MSEARIEDVSNPFTRKKFNEAIFRVIPTAFGITARMADLKQFNSLSKLESFLLSRAWSIKDTDHEKAVKLNRVGSNEANESVLSQERAVERWKLKKNLRLIIVMNMKKMRR